jgi:tetratricopeptide (TPR) repeat protein
MHIRCAAVVVILSARMLARSKPLSCPADRPVDDIIAEVHKQQSKKNHRNPNPFPEVSCIFGWCIDHSRTPPPFPEPAPRAKIPSGDGGPSISVNSSRIPENKCNDAMEIALDAAHNVDVGDYSFAEKNYKGALLRYQDAVEENPGDAAIHIRLARVFENLDQIPNAIEQYKTAQRLAGPGKWSDEAEVALLRLQRPPRK